jgi:hypothetical protein
MGGMARVWAGRGMGLLGGYCCCAGACPSLADDDEAEVSEAIRAFDSRTDLAILASRLFVVLAAHVQSVIVPNVFVMPRLEGCSSSSSTAEIGLGENIDISAD